MLGRGRWGRGALGQAVAVVSYCLLTYLSLTVHRAYRSQVTKMPNITIQNIIKKITPLLFYSKL